MTTIDWSTYATSLTYDETRLIADIIKLHNHNQPFELDPTYSTGRFWTDLPAPRFKFDLYPQVPGVMQADARALPLANASITSIMFDPPFIVGSRASGKPGLMKTRFGYYKTIPDLWGFYDQALVEFTRALKPNGIIAFKCQDTVSGGINYLSHVKVVTIAQQLGLYVKDLFILGRGSVMWSPNMAQQQHARKNHCYYVILEKRTREQARCN